MTVVELGRKHRTKEQNLKDVRRTVAWKRSQNARTEFKNGLPENWGSDALDMYLEGYNSCELGEMLDLSANTVMRVITREALFRLMEQHAIERMIKEDMEESGARGENNASAKAVPA